MPSAICVISSWCGWYPSAFFLQLDHDIVFFIGRDLSLYPHIGNPAFYIRGKYHVHHDTMTKKARTGGPRHDA